jgi:hypothetical protein
MKRVFVLTVLVLVVAVAALVGYKATRPAKVWPQEPESFLGVRLAVPLAASLHACNPQAAENGPCFESVEGRNTIQNVEGFWEINVDALNGNVVGISAFYDRDTGEKVFADLTKRFGQPQEQSQDANGKRAVWKGTVLSITFFNNSDGSGFVTAGLNDHRYRPAPHRWGLF